jgi:hypothetical protein
VETIKNVKTVFVFREKDQMEKSFPLEQLSSQDQTYVKEISGKP